MVILSEGRGDVPCYRAYLNGEAFRVGDTGEEVLTHEDVRGMDISPDDEKRVLRAMDELEDAARGRAATFQGRGGRFKIVREAARLVREANGPVEAYGFQGVQNKPWRKTFKTYKAFEAWLAKHEGDVSVEGVRAADTNEAATRRAEASPAKVSHAEAKKEIAKLHKKFHPFLPDDEAYEKALNARFPGMIHYEVDFDDLEAADRRIGAYQRKGYVDFEDPASHFEMGVLWYILVPKAQLSDSKDDALPSKTKEAHRTGAAHQAEASSNLNPDFPTEIFSTKIDRDGEVRIILKTKDEEDNSFYSFTPDEGEADDYSRHGRFDADAYLQHLLEYPPKEFKGLVVYQVTTVDEAIADSENFYVFLDKNRAVSAGERWSRDRDPSEYSVEIEETPLDAKQAKHLRDTGKNIIWSYPAADRKGR